MAQSVELADDIMTLIRREADLHSRSLSAQITHSLKIGREIEHSGSFNYTRITAALEGSPYPTQLGKDEDFAWLDAFTDEMGHPSEAEKSFFARRQNLGLGVGLDACGKLVYATNDTAA